MDSTELQAAKEALEFFRSPAVQYEGMKIENGLLRSALGWMRDRLSSEYAICRTDGRPMSPTDSSVFVQWFRFAEMVLSAEFKKGEETDKLTWHGKPITACSREELVAMMCSMARYQHEMDEIHKTMREIDNLYIGALQECLEPNEHLEVGA